MSECLKKDFLDSECKDFWVNQHLSIETDKNEKFCKKFNYDLKVSALCAEYFKVFDNLHFSEGISDSNFCL
jgi:hypothetical protein